MLLFDARARFPTSVEWFLSNALVVMINLIWASVSTSYKCLELLAVMTTNSRKTWLMYA